MTFTEDDIRQRIVTSLINAQLVSGKGSPSQTLHKDRSQTFVENLARQLGRLYPNEEGIRVFSKHNPSNWEDFRLNELLYDIVVCKVDKLPSVRHEKELPVITDVLWQVESEFAPDSREAIIDFNKLILGSAKNKLFIGPEIGEIHIESLINILKQAAKACMGNVYVALVPHPSNWENTVGDVRIWTLKEESVQKPPVTAQSVGVLDHQMVGARGDPTIVVQALLAYRSQQKTGGPLTGNKDADDFLRQNSFAFLMAAAIDRGARAETVWETPFHLRSKLGHLGPKALSQMNIDQLENVLRSLSRQPRYPRQAAQTISSLSELIVSQFNGNAEAIWKNREPREVIQTFRQIWGVGPGIAHMTIRILLDEFSYDPGLEGRRQIDVKADIHVIRIFYRTGLITGKSADICIQTARRLHPEFPGLLDWPAWEIGRTWCHENSPDCQGCPLCAVCPRTMT